jgi:hypothetical protein
MLSGRELELERERVTVCGGVDPGYKQITCLLHDRITQRTSDAETNSNGD